jgi:nicotinate-nucleotide adenylyltransferase
MKIGIFGGTFDPPHVGHLVLAAEALDQLQLDRVLWVLTPQPPHKPGQPVSPVDLRMDMLAAALVGEPSFELSRLELDRPPPHYAVETMRQLRMKFPEDWLIYLMGGDSLRDLPEWYKPLEFLAECSAIGVMLRPGAEIDIPKLEESLPGIADKVRMIGTPLLEISSSDIRKRIHQQRHFRYFLPESVFQIVLKSGIYHNLGS